MIGGRTIQMAKQGIYQLGVLADQALIGGAHEMPRLCKTAYLRSN